MNKIHPLEKWRITKNIDRKVLFALLNIHKNSYINYLKYKNVPSNKVLQKISNITNNEITFKDFLAVESNSEPQENICTFIKETLRVNKIPLKQLTGILNINISSISKKINKNNLSKTEIEMIIEFIEATKKQQRKNKGKKGNFLK